MRKTLGKKGDAAPGIQPITYIILFLIVFVAILILFNQKFGITKKATESIIDPLSEIDSQFMKGILNLEDMSEQERKKLMPEEELRLLLLHAQEAQDQGNQDKALDYYKEYLQKCAQEPYTQHCTQKGKETAQNNINLIEQSLTNQEKTQQLNQYAIQANAPPGTLTEEEKLQLLQQLSAFKTSVDGKLLVDTLTLITQLCRSLNEPPEELCSTQFEQGSYAYYMNQAAQAEQNLATAPTDPEYFQYINNAAYFYTQAELIGPDQQSQFYAAQKRAFLYYFTSNGQTPNTPRYLYPQAAYEYEQILTTYPSLVDTTITSPLKRLAELGHASTIKWDIQILGAPLAKTGWYTKSQAPLNWPLDLNFAPDDSRNFLDLSIYQTQYHQITPEMQEITQIEKNQPLKLKIKFPSQFTQYKNIPSTSANAAFGWIDDDQRDDNGQTTIIMRFFDQNNQLLCAYTSSSNSIETFYSLLPFNSQFQLFLKGPSIPSSGKCPFIIPQLQLHQPSQKTLDMDFTLSVDYLFNVKPPQTTFTQ